MATALQHSDLLDADLLLPALVELAGSSPRLNGAIVGRALYEGSLELAAAIELASRAT